MVIVTWPSIIADKAEIWRVLDLSGLSRSVRESRAFVLSKYVYLDGSLVSTLKDKVSIGKEFTLEVRFPSGKVKFKRLFLRNRGTRSKPRDNFPRDERRKG